MAGRVTVILPSDEKREHIVDDRSELAKLVSVYAGPYLREGCLVASDDVDELGTSMRLVFTCGPIVFIYEGDDFEDEGDAYEFIEEELLQG